jgi:hypothetical protein
MKKPTNILSLLLFCSIPMLALLLSACRASNSVNDYLYIDPTSATYLTWTNKDGNLTGVAYETYMSTPAQDKLQSTSAGLSGSQNGATITLTFSYLGLPVQTYTGALNNTQLSITVPQSSGTLQTAVLTQASITDYNYAVTHLQSVVAEKQRAKASQQRAEALAAEQAKLRTDMSTLAQDSDFSGVLSPYKSSIADMQASLQAEKQDGCTSALYIDHQGVINGNQGVIDADYGFSQKVTTVQGDIKGVQDDANALGKPMPDISIYQQALSSAQSKAAAYDTQAKQLRSQAQALVDACGS